jgi:dihydroneopterin aldolase
MNDRPKLEGLVPQALAPRTRKVVLQDYALSVDIGFHEYEIGAPQRLLVTVEIWLDAPSFPTDDSVAGAWDYDVLRSGIAALVEGRRFNLQETVAREIYDLVAARRGVQALRVATRKADVYPDCAGVGVDLASF